MGEGTLDTPGPLNGTSKARIQAFVWKLFFVIVIANSRVPTEPIYAIVCMCCSMFGNWVISVPVPMNLQLSYDLEGLYDLVPWLKISINARSPFSAVTDAIKYTDGSIKIIYF